MNMRRLILLAILVCCVALAGCGGGGGGGGGSTVVSGVVSKGPVANSSVSVYAIRSGVVDTTPLAAAVTTDANGAFTVNLGGYAGPILVQAKNGTYVDEATGGNADISGVADGFRAYVETASGSTTVAVTAITELAARRIAAATPSAENIRKHNGDIALLFGLSDIIGVRPVNAGAALPAGAGQAEINYGLALASVAKTRELKAETLGGVLTRLGGPVTDLMLLDLQTANSQFLSSAANKTGVNGTQNGATIINLTLGTSGTLGATTKIGGVNLTINLPPGVTVDIEPGTTNRVATAALKLSGEVDLLTTNNKFIDGSYTPAVPNISPAKVKILIGGTSGFGTGVFATLKLNKGASTVTLPSQLTPTGFLAEDTPNASPLGGLLPTVGIVFQ